MISADWLKLIPQYTKEYDEAKKIFKDKPLHDWTSHGADEFRYAALIEDVASSVGMFVEPFPVLRSGSAPPDISI
jgi:hypothetical protein